MEHFSEVFSTKVEHFSEISGIIASQNGYRFKIAYLYGGKHSSLKKNI